MRASSYRSDTANTVLIHYKCSVYNYCLPCSVPIWSLKNVKQAVLRLSLGMPKHFFSGQNLAFVALVGEGYRSEQRVRISLLLPKCYLIFLIIVSICCCCFFQKSGFFVELRLKSSGESITIVYTLLCTVCTNEEHVTL
ncbi:unnamed protein product [Ixodes pacificus]